MRNLHSQLDRITGIMPDLGRSRALDNVRVMSVMSGNSARVGGCFKACGRRT